MTTPKATVVSENRDRWRHADCYACHCPVAAAAHAITNRWAVQIATDLVELGTARYGPPRERGYIDPLRHFVPPRRSVSFMPGIVGGLTINKDFHVTCDKCGEEQDVIVAELRGGPTTSAEDALIAADPSAYDRGQVMSGANVALALSRLKASRRPGPLSRRNEPC